MYSKMKLGINGFPWEHWLVYDTLGRENVTGKEQVAVGVL